MNLSFGYGGYWLPKDAKQLSVNCRYMQNLIETIVWADCIREDFIADEIIDRVRNLVYGGREAGGGASFDCEERLRQLYARVPSRGIMKRVKAKGVSVLACGSTSEDPGFFGGKVTHEFEDFRINCDEASANC